MPLNKANLELYNRASRMQVPSVHDLFLLKGIVFGF